MADTTLTTQWAVCGIAAAAARFIPVPLLDDVVRRGAVRLAVKRTVQAHGLRRPPEALEPLWGGDIAGSRKGRRLRALGRRLLLFPVRKYTALFGAVRGVPADVLRVVLLARSVDRALDRGGLTRPEDAAALRSAVDASLRGEDLRLVLAAVSDGLSQTRGLSAAAVTLARRRFAGSDGEEAVLPAAPVAEGAQRVNEVLARPDVVVLLERFDARVDAELRPTS